MRLNLGPVLYHRSREELLAFYENAAEWPLDGVYIGETVCSKRQELKLRDRLAIAREIASTGKQVVLSTLALVEAESELGVLQRICEQQEFMVEANDMAAVQALAGTGRPFVIGHALNVYNARSLATLVAAGGAVWVPPMEMSAADLSRVMSQAEARGTAPEVEVFAWGRQPLSYSARCFTARAEGRTKDDCGFVCSRYPDGMPLRTREGEILLTVNGIQVQGGTPCDLGPHLLELQAMGIAALRISPAATGTAEVVRRFSDWLADPGSEPVSTPGYTDGYWRGGPGMASGASGQTGGR